MRGVPREEDVREYLRRNLAATRCDYLRFPGNYGDAVIWHGTQRILQETGVQYRQIDCDDSPGNEVLIVDGGGNLVDLYSDVRIFLERDGPKYERVVVLPHTIAGPLSLACLQSLGNRLVIFCRERQ